VTPHLVVTRVQVTLHAETWNTTLPGGAIENYGSVYHRFIRLSHRGYRTQQLWLWPAVPEIPLGPDVPMYKNIFLAHTLNLSVSHIRTRCSSASRR
jgi:hypothetical protein